MGFECHFGTLVLVAYNAEIYVEFSGRWHALMLLRIAVSCKTAPQANEGSGSTRAQRPPRERLT